MIKNLIMKKGTTVGFTGGTDQTFRMDGISIPMGIHVADVSPENLTLQEHITFKTRSPKLTGRVWSKAKRQISYVVPLLVDDEVVFNVIRQEIEFHPRITTSRLATLRGNAAQLIAGSATNDFFNLGTLE